MEFVQGGTFIIALPPKDVKHLFVILSDIERYPDQVVIVNFTSCRSWGEETCVLKKGQHPFIKHDTTIYYIDAKIITKKMLHTSVISHPTFNHHEPVSNEVFELILKGAMDSRFIPTKIRKALEEQGLI